MTASVEGRGIDREGAGNAEPKPRADPIGRRLKGLNNPGMLPEAVAAGDGEAHTASVEMVQPCNVPFGQAVQTAHPAAPGCAANVPGAHAVQDAAPDARALYAPGAHVVHAVDVFAAATSL